MKNAKLQNIGSGHAQGVGGSCKAGSSSHSRPLTQRHGFCRKHRPSAILLWWVYGEGDGTGDALGADKPAAHTSYLVCPPPGWWQQLQAVEGQCSTHRVHGHNLMMFNWQSPWSIQACSICSSVCHTPQRPLHLPLPACCHRVAQQAGICRPPAAARPQHRPCCRPARLGCCALCCVLEPTPRPAFQGAPPPPPRPPAAAIPWSADTFVSITGVGQQLLSALRSTCGTLECAVLPDCCSGIQG
jgi:hypothetical protein